ncbi:MAG: hypothetical protein IKU15_08575 [Clostridia bacterium]|nr:hypothetical protein [Clostridia bacterium]
MKDNKSKEKKKDEAPADFEKKLKAQLSDLSKKGDWNTKDLLSLKGCLYPINNHITYLMGMAFLKKYFGITKEPEYFQYSKMNNNGYDIAAEINGSLIIAEIKGNIPCGTEDQEGNKLYGANQKKSIEKDIENLNNLKDKGKKQIEKLDDFANAYKCLVLLKNNETAINHLIKINNLSSNTVIIDSNNINLEKGKINIILIDL